MSNSTLNQDIVLQVRDLKQHFKRGRSVNKAVDDVNFDIYKGEVFGLVGESGCGKTTTGRTVIRLYQATGGQVFLNGKRIIASPAEYALQIKELKADQALDETQKREKIEQLSQEYQQAKKDNKEAISTRATTAIQMIFQDPIASLNPRMTVFEIIAEGLRIRGIKDRPTLEEKVFGVLELVGLVPEHANRYPHEFSGGQRQRIGIARAVVLEPEVLIADEPVSALDVSIQAQVINLLNDLRAKKGLTILFIAHNLSVVKYFSDRIAVMYSGKIMEQATTQQLFENPCHPYTKSLISAIPNPDPMAEKLRQRVIYNPLIDHDYKTDKPIMRDIGDRHLVYCNDAEYAKYSQQK